MKFAHMADCHLGSWKHPELQKLNAESFNYAIERCIEEKVKFVLIVGDLFDSAIPPIDVLKEATSKLKELKDAGIKCYLVPGSHDFSISGKSMIHVLEKAGLCQDVTKPIETEDYYIAGLGGEKRGLEIKKVSSIKPKKSNKTKILLLHTTLKEMNLPIESISIKDLPNGFDYYALGHIHQKKIFDKDDAKVIYPGAIFPCNFTELEKDCGSFCIVSLEDKRAEIKEIPIKLKEVKNYKINADDETPVSLKEKILEKVDNVKGKITTLRISGTLSSGKPSEINFTEIEQELKERGACCVLKNTSKIVTKEFGLADKDLKNLEVDLMDISKIEKQIVEEMIKKEIVNEREKSRILELMKYLDTEKAEGETNEVFSSRLSKEIIKKLNLDFVENVD
jgi:DNA repair exonuclease SbcCD nuclease subunit